MTDILAHFRKALPNEAAAFILWNEKSKDFDIQYPTIEHATPARLVYRPPVLPEHCHMVCDVHSHGHGPAFFSLTDDADDAHSTKISIVLGAVDQPEGPSIAARMCAGGMFLPIPRSPFAGDHDVQWSN